MKASKVVQAETPSTERYRTILLEVARLHEKYVASNPEPFNVFSVLRSHSDEVNLHSRFLAAVLDHRKPNEEKRSNLEAFLESVAGVDGFEQRGVLVEREKYNIDILITNANRQAVIIENKIWAGDQPEQLQRYYKEMIDREFPNDQIHLRYLTPFGHDPSDESVGTLNRNRIVNIAYKDPEFQDWLRSCQQRAYDQPELRESVGQYLRVIQKLTGTDVDDSHLEELKSLCLEKDHLALLHDLRHAFDESWISLIKRLFSEIEAELAQLKDMLPDEHRISDSIIRQLVTGSKNEWCGLYFKLNDHSWLGIELNTWPSRHPGLFFGVMCDRKNTGVEHDRIKKDLSGSDWSTNGWPYIKYLYSDVNPSPRNPSRESLTLMANDTDRKKFARDIANELSALWQKIQEAGLVPPPNS